ncbi:hypothetical protein D3C78_1053060 [compost metagenome]
MHKHYTNSNFLPKNLMNQWFEGYGAKNKLLSKEIENIIPLGSVIEDDLEARRVAGKIAHLAISEGYKRRANRKLMTGEWIIYYVHEGLNYYLDVARHCDAETPKAEQALLDRLKRSCEWEFPFAFEK